MESIIKRHRIALVLAGGYGGRMHMETPKQFLLLQGMPVIAHTLKAFENHPEIDVIAVVCLSGWEEYVERVKHDFHITKLQHIFSGGSNSHISIGDGIKGLYGLCYRQRLFLRISGYVNCMEMQLLLSGITKLLCILKMEFLRIVVFLVNKCIRHRLLIHLF